MSTTLPSWMVTSGPLKDTPTAEAESKEKMIYMLALTRCEYSKQNRLKTQQQQVQGQIHVITLMHTNA